MDWRIARRYTVKVFKITRFKYTRNEIKLKLTPVKYESDSHTEGSAPISVLYANGKCIKVDKINFVDVGVHIFKGF